MGAPGGEELEALRAEVAELRAERVQWKCRSWLGGSRGRSTVLALRGGGGAVGGGAEAGGGGGRHPLDEELERQGRGGELKEEWRPEAVDRRGAELVAAQDEAERLRSELEEVRVTEASKLALEREARLSITTLVGQQAQELERLKARTAALEAENQLLEEGSELAAVEDRAREAEERERLAWVEAQKEREKVGIEREVAAGLQRRLETLVEASDAQAAEIRGLADRVAVAESEGARATAALGQARDDLAAARLTLDQTETAATAAQQRCVGLAAAGERLEAQIKESEQARAEAVEACTSEAAQGRTLQDARDAARERCQELKQEATGLTVRLKDTHRELKESDERFEHLKRSMRAASRIQEDTQKSLEADLRRKSSELAIAEQELEHLSERCREMEAETKAAGSRAAAANREGAVLLDERDRLRREVDGREERLLRKAGELRSAEARCQSLEAEMQRGAEAHDEALRSVQRECRNREDALWGDLERAQGRAEEAGRARKVAEDLSTRLEVEKRVAEANLAGENLKVTDLLVKVDALRRDLGELEGTKARAVELEAESSIINVKLQASVEALQALHLSHAQTMKELTGLREAHELEKAASQEALKVARGESAKFRLEVEQRKSSAEGLLVEFDRQGTEVARLKSRLSVLEEESKAGGEAQLKLRSALDAKQGEVEALQGKLQRGERLAPNLAEAQNRMESLTRELRAREEAANRASETEDALKTSLAESRATCEKATRELTAEFQRSSCLEREVETLRQRAEAVAAETAEIGVLKNDLEIMHRSKTEKDAEVKELKDRVRRLQEEPHSAEKENCSSASAAGGISGSGTGGGGVLGQPPPGAPPHAPATAANLREADCNRPKAAGGANKSKVWNAEERERMLARLRRVSKRHGLRLAIPLREEPDTSPATCQAHLLKLMAGVLGALEQAPPTTAAAAIATSTATAPERAALPPRPASGRARGIASLRAAPAPASGRRQRVLMLH